MIQVEEQGALSVGLFGYSRDWETFSQSGVNNYLRFEDGSSRYEFVGSYGDAAVQIENQIINETTTLEDATVTLVVQNVHGSMTSSLDALINGGTPADAQPGNGSQHIQFTLTADDIEQLRVAAQAVADTADQRGIQFDTDLAHSIAAAKTNEEVIHVIMRRASSNPQMLVNDILSLGLTYANLSGAEHFAVVLPGTFSHTPAQ